MVKLAAHDSWDECSNHSGLKVKTSIILEKEEDKAYSYNGKTSYICLFGIKLKY